jgi:hypothetical protein
MELKLRDATPEDATTGCQVLRRSITELYVIDHKNEGLLHPQMEHLGRLCEAHPEVAPEIFQFLEELLTGKVAISEIENAVAISFLDWQAVLRLGFSKPLPAKLADTIKDQWFNATLKPPLPIGHAAIVRRDVAQFSCSGRDDLGGEQTWCIAPPGHWRVQVWALAVRKRGSGVINPDRLRCNEAKCGLRAVICRSSSIEHTADVG